MFVRTFAENNISLLDVEINEFLKNLPDGYQVHACNIKYSSHFDNINNKNIFSAVIPVSVI
ncbi:MAG: hypothetical protein WC917_04790 [Bacilli bacterium]|jgi:hypothetical protein